MDQLPNPTFSLKNRIFNQKDEQGRPAGGNAYGDGYSISWQRGPITEDNPVNGAQVEDVLQACRHRLDFFQQSEFNCEENELAIEAIDRAIALQQLRTRRRTNEGTEGTYKEDH